MKMTSDYPAQNMTTAMSWFAIGLLSGAAVALLTSPKTGRENRQVLRRRAQEVADTVTERGGELIRSQKDVVERGRAQVQAFGSRVGEAIEQGKNAYRSAKTQVDDAVSAVSSSMSETAEDLSGRRPL